MLDVVEFGVVLDGFFVGLDIGILDFVVFWVVFVVDLGIWVVIVVDVSVVGLDLDDFVLGVGWFVIGVLVYVLLLLVVFMLFG